MLKKITYILSAVMLCSCVMLGPSFDSEAASYEFNMPYGQPTTSENSGYLEVLMYDTKLGYFCDVFYWNITADNSSSVTSMYISVYGNGKVTFEPCVPSLNDSFSYSLMYIGSSGNVSYMHGGYFNGYASYTYDVSQYGYTIVSYRVYGNYGSVFDSVNKPMTQFTCFYGADKFELEKLTNIYNQLVQANANDTQMISKLDSIMHSNASIDVKLNQLIDLQNSTITWLEKIFNYLNESQEKQKEAASQQGNSSVSQGSSAIEDKGGDFVGSLSGLTNSMSYTGTQCAWEFPQVKLPAIPGVMDEMVLIKKQPIDFAVWVDAIPSDILLVVQSLCTAGLIIYCFKELYSTIAYVLTLRKDDNS